ncbi:hypothetical protein EVAR_8577_1 [Eumeta japonica]|uniref:Uncharacterized protein n=1 Tax=Eumeta variegata TaxID=151549 RepID=A0A4C1TXH8_EUMVA|nr:hypothetical protein EVAR_8577_1 [Eumeta japonica]
MQLTYPKLLKEAQRKNTIFIYRLPRLDELHAFHERKLDPKDAENSIHGYRLAAALKQTTLRRQETEIDRIDGRIRFTEYKQCFRECRIRLNAVLRVPAMTFASAKALLELKIIFDTACVYYKLKSGKRVGYAPEKF